MRKYMILLSAILTSTFVMAGATGQNTFSVEPGTVYNLSFTSVQRNNAGGRWEITIYDQDGTVPAENGLLNAAWQKLPKDYNGGVITQRFRTSPYAKEAKLSFYVDGKLSANAVSDVKLEKDQSGNILESSDVFQSLHDYSGFDDISQADFVQEGEKYVLKIRPRGYAVSNFIPVSPGKYKLGTAKRSTVVLFPYDKDQNLLKPVMCGNVIDIQENTAYIRFFFGGNGFLEGLSLVRDGELQKQIAPAKQKVVSAQPVNGNPAIVSNSQPAAEIIIDGSGSDFREQFAARELHYWIKTVSAGAELPILSEASPANCTKIFIGRKYAENLFNDDLKKLEGTEGFAIRKNDNNVYIFGASPNGTLFGTWRFIENSTDLIWSRPNLEYGAVYDIQKNIAALKTDYIDIPVFKMRSWSMPGGVSDGEITNLYYARNGANPFFSANNFGWTAYISKLYARSMKVGGGFMYGFLGKYAETNPEFFPLADGRRKITNHAQPCFTNPGAIAAIIKEARIHLENAPDENVYLDCGNEDTWLCCECETCLAPIKLPDGTLLEPKAKSSEADPYFRSTQLYMFLNKIAEALEEDYPDTKIITLAYIFSAEHPAVKVHKNVLSLYAPYPTHDMRIPLRNSHSKGTANGTTWSQRFKTWGESGSPLAFYEYWGNATFNAIPDAAAENLRDLKNYNGWGINSEALQEFDENLYGIGNFKQMWDVNSMNMWVITRLMWNPEQDVNALRSEFIKKTYREAAPQMEKFFGIIVKNWNNLKIGGQESCHTGRTTVFKRYIVDPGNEKEARTLLVEAEKAAQNPHSKILVQDVLKSFDEWAVALGRIRAPLVEEATEQAFDFSTPHWQKAQIIDALYFPRQYLTPLENREKMEDSTTFRVMRDKDHLYIKVTANVPDVNKLALTPKSDAEIFPYGEHAEVQFRVKGQIYLFAFDANGNKYDAKNWDRSWNSGWKVQGHKNRDSWEAVIAIPFSDLNFNPETDEISSPLEFMPSRIRADRGAKQQENTYKGFAPNGEHIWSPLSMN